MTWPVEVDHVTGLLAAEQPALAAQRLEHVPVADVGREHADAALAHQPVEAEVRHRRHGDQVDAESEREDRDDLVAVDRRAVLVDREHAVAVAVEGDAEVVRAVAHNLLQRSEVRGAAADVDVGAVGRVGDRGHLGAESLEHARRDRRVGAVGAVDGDAQAREVGAEMLDDMLDVAVGGRLDGLDRASTGPLGVEQRLDLLLLGASVSLWPSRSKNLTPLYSGGLCDAEMTTPRSSASSATAGVGSTPPSTATPPAETMPRASASSSSGPEPRVSRPTKTRPRPDHSVAAQPRRSTRSGVSVSPTMPRTPSVPK